MTAVTEQTPLTALEQVDVLDKLILGMGISEVAACHRHPPDLVEAVATANGWPDPAAMRTARRQLRRLPRWPTPPAPRIPDPPEPFQDPDHPAVHVALRLCAALRDHDRTTISALFAGLGTQALTEVTIAALAMLRPDVDAHQALEWLDVAPAEWSKTTITAERERWRAGARDRTAVTANDLADRGAAG